MRHPGSSNTMSDNNLDSEIHARTLDDFLVSFFIHSVITKTVDNSTAKTKAKRGLRALLDTAFGN